MPRTSNDAIRWDVDYLDQLGAGVFEAASRCCIFWVAGNPDGVDAELRCQWHQKTQRTGGIPLAPCLRMHRKPDVTCITFNVPC